MALVTFRCDLANTVISAAELVLLSLTLEQNFAGTHQPGLFYIYLAKKNLKRSPMLANVLKSVCTWSASEFFLFLTSSHLPLWRKRVTYIRGKFPAKTCQQKWVTFVPTTLACKQALQWLSLKLKSISLFRTISLGNPFAGYYNVYVR